VEWSNYKNLQVTQKASPFFAGAKAQKKVSLFCAPEVGVSFSNFIKVLKPRLVGVVIVERLCL